MGTPGTPDKRVGLGYWMQEVLDQCDKVGNGFGSDPVHDLRTALRRCRSMADGMRVFDSNPAWKRMKKAGKALFSSLGDLRDAHVIEDWVEKLSSDDEPTSKALLNHLAGQEHQHQKIAAAALDQFDRKQWKNWAAELPERAAQVPIDSPVFAHLALERWQDAYALHRKALRNRSNVAFHELRIGLKRLRYTVENFLPSLHENWGADLKDLQDLLGDVHDLYVLWQTALQIKAFPDADARVRWRSRLVQERQQRLNTYRSKMTGPNSLWWVWRAALPASEELHSLALERLQIWASFLDPEFGHAEHVADLAMQLYDRIPIDGVLPRSKREEYRSTLRAAALMHDVGRSRANKGHHKASARLIRKLGVPLGWTSAELRLAALVARYHRGALPKETQRTFAALPQSKQRLVQFLGGILRLACACDRQHDGRIKRMELESCDPVCTIRADGYDEAAPLAEHLAAARYLLELACQRPIFIRPMPSGIEPHAA